MFKKNQIQVWGMAALLLIAAACQDATTATKTLSANDTADARRSKPTTPPKDTTPTAPPKDTTTAPAQTAGNTAWTFCTNAGAMCDFIGLRDVRLSDASNTKFVTQTVYHEVPCAGYGFNNQNPSSGQLHCDYSPIKMQTLSNAANMAPITASSVSVPMGAPGSGKQDVQSGGGNGTYTDGSGSFRTTCSLSKMLFDDPIVFPGQPGKSHLHMFFGNTAITGNTTPDNIKTTGNGACRGGTLNRTAYWTPAMYDTKTSTVVMPDEETVYYKTGYNMDPKTIKVMPSGLRMIAGDKSATAAQWAGPQQIITWTCLNGSASSANSATIPNCKVGDAVRLTVIFPQCWDGKNLDSPDHKSHMSYPNYNSSKRSTCPAAFPIPVPEMTEHFDFPVLPGVSPSTWRLSSDMDASKAAGLTAHADWMMAWDSATMNSLVVNCLNKALDCGVGGIGANKSLF
ncbi:MAG TPA: DUF1996 domain-containing protein [Gemmatimonadaceae bacterium]